MNLSRKSVVVMIAACVAIFLSNPESFADTAEKHSMKSQCEVAMLHPVNPSGTLIPGISQGMIVEGGRLLFLSGHVPFDAEGKVVGSDVSVQLDQVFRNLQATLHAAGTDFSSLARITIYVRDYTPDLLPKIRTVRDTWIALDHPPASALIGVAALAHPDILVEVDAVGVLPSKPTSCDANAL